MRFTNFVTCGLLATAVSACTSATPPQSAAKQSNVAQVGAAQINSTITVTELPAEKIINAETRAIFDEATRALKAGRADEAQRGFLKLTQTNPELSGPHANLGLIYRSANKLPEALKEFELAVHLKPNHAVYHNQLGISYRQLGQFDKARVAYEQAMTIDKSYASAILNLGILHDMYMGDAKRALELYTQYLALTPAGDAQVSKWIAELKNRKAAPGSVAAKEKT